MKLVKIWLSFIFLLQVNSLAAQQYVIDSLEQQIIESADESTKVRVLNELSWYYALSDVEKGVQRANTAIKLATEINDSVQLGISFERKGYNYQNLGNDSLTLVFYTKAVEVYTGLDDYRRLAGLSYNTANFYFYRSKYLESLKEIEKPLEFYKEQRDSIRLGRVQNLIGLNHMYLGNYPVSMKSFQSGLLLLELTNNEESQFYAEILGNKALLYEKLSDFEKALEFQHKALNIHTKNEYQLGVSNTYTNIGQLYGHLEEPEKALAMFNKALEIKYMLGNKLGIANALSNLGIAHNQLNNYQKSYEFLTEAKSIYEKLEHNSNLSSVHTSLGNLLLDQNGIVDADKNFAQALEYANRSNDKRAAYLAKNGLSEAAYRSADYKRAFLLFQEVAILKDSLLSTEKRDELAQIEAKFEYEKEKALLQADFEKERLLNKTKLEHQILVRNMSIGSGLFGMVVLTVGFLLVKRKKEAELSSKIATSELETLKAQLNPHFIFNTLNSINSYMVKNKKEEASAYLIRFSKMMRKILDHTRQDEIPLDEEIEFLDNYIKLEQERLEGKFSYSIEVDPNIDLEETYMPPSLLQPIVENSIWHGLSKKDKGGYLKIGFAQQGKNLVCAIEDNGLGMPTENNKTAGHTPFGKSSVQNRLELLNRLKGSSEAKMRYIGQKEGVRVEVQIPQI